VDPEYGKRYPELYQKHWWWRAREEAIMGALRRHQPPQGWGTILDVGCGDGLFFDRLSQFGDVEGIESAEAVVSDTGPHRKRIHVGSFDQSFQSGKRYSLILMLDVLEHLHDAAGALRHALRLLIPGGTLLATVPAFNLLWTNHDILNHHLCRYTRSDFRELAQQVGLRIESEQYLFQWIFLAKLLLRVVERVFRLPPKIPEIPPRWANQSLYLLSRLEQKTLGVLPVPFGSSLLVLGRKPPM
jgi:2-polyprenyl-3-methyl-5-hydroxy-6-metoxy-1,4-benzoquinol methylase